MSKKYVWLNRGQVFDQTEANIKILEGKLPVGIYKPFLDMSGWHLQCIEDEFNFPYKIYDLQVEFIDHVLKTWNNTNRNLGILLNGIKGTGKSVTGKIIANKVKLPVILIESNGDGLMNYLKSIDFDCVLFFDEYEKTFDQGNEILTLMDGMFSELSRKLFVLTTNNKYINDNLISRPSRIRYFLEFDNIPAETISAYLNDNLNNKNRKQEICEFINGLKNCTIDIVKAIVDEINLHECSTETLQKYMNLTMQEYRYTVHCLFNGYGEHYIKGGIQNFEQAKSVFEMQGKPGKNRYGDDTMYISYNDLDIRNEYMKFSKKFDELKPGDWIDCSRDYKLKEIKGEFLICEYGGDPENPVYVRVEDWDKTQSLYPGLSYIY